MVICLDMLCASDRAQAARKTGGEKPAEDRCLTLVFSLQDAVSFSSVHVWEIPSAFYCFSLFHPLGNLFPFSYHLLEVLMPATFRRSPEVPYPEHINKRECQTVVIGVFFRVYWINACLYGCFCGAGIDVGGFASLPSLFEVQPADATNQCDGTWLSCTTDRKF